MNKIKENEFPPNENRKNQTIIITAEINGNPFVWFYILLFYIIQNVIVHKICAYSTITSKITHILYYIIHGIVNRPYSIHSSHNNFSRLLRKHSQTRPTYIYYINSLFLVWRIFYLCCTICIYHIWKYVIHILKSIRKCSVLCHSI